VQMLAAAGIENPVFEARLLLAHALRVSTLQIITGSHPSPAPRDRQYFASLIARRSERIPLAYLRGQQEFYGLPFMVDPSVLIPRPETEMLVDSVIRNYNSTLLPLSVSESLQGGEAFTVADVGTGSGCIAVAVLAHCPTARAIGVELSPPALALARRNASLNSVADRMRLVQGNLLTAAADQRFDVIVSNPPYVSTAEITMLQPEVRDYEPRLALDGGPDGLAAYPHLAAAARRVLKPGGHLYVEVGQGQGREVARIFRETGLEDVAITPDLAGIDRIVSGKHYADTALQPLT